MALVLKRLAIEACVVDGDRRSVGKVERACDVGLGVPAARLGRHERDRAQRPAARDKRHHHRRAKAELSNRLEQLRLICEQLDEHRVRDLGIELGLPRANRLRDTLRRIGVGSQPICQLVRPADLLRVDVRRGEALDRSIFGDHVDRAPVGEGRNDEPGHVRKRRFVFERRGELLARQRDQPSILCELRLLRKDLCSSDRGGCDVRDRCDRTDLGSGELTPLSVVEDKGADHLFAALERQRKECTRSLLGVRAFMRRRQPFRGGDIAGDDRPGRRHHVLVPTNRLARNGDVRVRETVRRLQHPLVRLRGAAPKTVCVGGESPAGELQDLRQESVEVERREEPAAGLDQQAEAGDLLLLFQQEIVE